MKKTKKEIKKTNPIDKIQIVKKKKVKNDSVKKKTDNISKKKTRKEKIKFALKIALIVFISLFIIGIIAASIFMYSIIKHAPEFNPDELYQKEASILYDTDGKIIAKLGTQKRESITYEQLPEVLVDAIVATEDSRFFQHNGFDLPRFIKASLGQLLGNSSAGGASTLTMQLSKNVYTSTEDEGIEGIKRKFTDIYMSIEKIEKKYTKKAILEFYVNYNFLGGTSVINGGAYGVEQACLIYFGKSAKDINLAEAALIAGLFQAPFSYDPYLYPEDAENRRQTVLYLMKRHGYITDEEYNVAKELTVDKLLLKEHESTGGEYQSFIDMVVNDVIDEYGVNPYDTPLEIWTTMDRKKQDHVNSIMTGTESPVTGLTYEWQNDVVDAGISVIDVKTGAIVAIGGSRRTNGALQWNNATMISKHIGSTAKPLYDYGPGIEFKNWSTYTPFTDEPHSYSNGVKISNWNYTYNGFLTLRQSVNGSWNIPALKAFQANDQANIIKFVTGLGLTPEIYSCDEGYKLDKKKCINTENSNDVVDAKQSNTLHESHALGGYEGESPLTLSAAYAAFANGGYYIKPYSYTKIVFRDTGDVHETKVQKTRAMSAETAYMITDVLVSTVPHALGRYSYVNGVTYGAKTGTSNYPEKIFKDYNLPSNAVNDIWVAGISPNYSIAVWYGYDRVYSDYYNVISSGQNSRIFQAVAKGIFTEKASFTRPSNVVSVSVEKESYPAMLPSEFTPDDMKTTELFKRGTEPTETSNRYSKLNDTANLSAKIENNQVIITWDKIDTPDAINLDKLKEYFKKLYKRTEDQEKYLNQRLSYNSSNIGEIGYNVYLKDENGNLTLLGFTKDNSYKYNLSDKEEYTFVVKSCYSIFKNNMSNGKEVKVINKKKEINILLNGDANTSVNINEKYNELGIKVTEDNVDVTNKAKINTSIIRKSDNKEVSSVDTSKVDAFEITYNITYNEVSRTLKRTVSIKNIKPLNLVATPDIKAIKLNWEATNGATKYRVQRLNGEQWQTIETPVTNSYIDNNLVSGQTYSYRVLALINDNWTDASDIVSAQAK